MSEFLKRWNGEISFRIRSVEPEKSTLPAIACKAAVGSGINTFTPGVSGLDRVIVQASGQILPEVIMVDFPTSSSLSGGSPCRLGSGLCCIPSHFVRGPAVGL